MYLIFMIASCISLPVDEGTMCALLTGNESHSSTASNGQAEDHHKDGSTCREDRLSFGLP
jgi:hypothetical protein